MFPTYTHRMSPAMSRTVSALLCCLAMATAPAAAQAGTPTVTDRMRQGEIHSNSLPYPGTSVQWGRAAIVLDAPIDRVMSVIENYAGYKEFLPNFETSRVLSQRGTSANVYVELKIMNGAATIWAELKLRAKKSDSQTRVIEGTMTKGNVKFFHALWEVTPYGNGKTVVAIQMMVDPDLPIPSSMLSNENKISARKALRALRDKLGLPAPAQKPAK